MAESVNSTRPLTESSTGTSSSITSRLPMNWKLPATVLSMRRRSGSTSFSERRPRPCASIVRVAPSSILSTGLCAMKRRKSDVADSASPTISSTSS
jgi:hypothetical protein